MSLVAGPDELVFVGSAGPGNGDFALFDVVPLTEGLVGSAPSCELRLSDPFVAPGHARILLRHDHWYIAAAAIGVQVFVDGRSALPNEALLLSPGSFVEIGDTWFTVGGGRERPALPADDTEAMLIVADELLEAGDPLGERIVANSTDVPGQLVAATTAGDLHVEWRHGLFEALSMRFRNSSGLEMRSTLRSILQLPVSSAIRRLAVFTETIVDGDAEEHLRFVLHAVAATRPPLLNHLVLGVVDVDVAVVEPELNALKRRLPLRTECASLIRRPRSPAIVIISSDGWPVTAGQRLDVTPDLTLLPEEAPAAPDEELELDGIQFGDCGSGRWVLHASEFSINGYPAEWGSPIRTGDVVSGVGLRFQFET